MTQNFRTLLFAGLMALLAAPALAQFNQRADIPYGDQRLVLGLPKANVSAFIDDLVSRKEYAIHGMDAYEAADEMFFNIILGPRDRGWWVAHALKWDRYPSFMAEKEAEGWCAVSSEPYFLEGYVHFAVVLTKRDCRDQLRFVYEKPRYKEGVFLRDGARSDSAKWKARRPAFGMESNGPVNLPAGYTLQNMRVLTIGLAEYTSVIYERTGRSEEKYITSRNYDSFIYMSQEYGSDGWWIADLDLSQELSLGGKLDNFNVVYAPISGPIGPVEPRYVDQMRSHLEGLPGQRILWVSGFERRDGRHMYWIQTEPR